MSAATKGAERAEAVAKLRELLPPGATVYTILRHVSRSGMQRSISLVLCGPDGPTDLDWLAVRVGLGTYDRNRSGIKIGGCGMDMGFNLVYNLSWTIYPDGFECIGEGCPANDHHNPPHPDKVAGSMHHRDGGYAIRQRWL